MLEVDGVPVLMAPTSGPMRAGLMFRVGRVDETLATSGITHLVEHLALHRHGTPDYHYNGMTSATTTQFVIQGAGDAIVAYLNDVCAGLRDLSLERLAVEKKLLETEASNRPTPVNQMLPLWRHGARDFGLVSYPEWGMQSLREEQVLQWAHTYFNRANAVLWIAGDRIPSGLRLDLPDGQRWPLPPESSAAPTLPAYFAADSPILVMDGQVPRTRAAAAFARALDRVLFRELRQNRGLSYTAAAAYTTDGRPHATVTAIVDAQPDQIGDALDCLLAEVRNLAQTETADSELETIRALELEGLSDPEVDARLLPRRATDLLTGFRSATTRELIDGFRTMTAKQVSAAAGTFVGTAMLMLPGSHAHRATGFEAAPTFSRFAATGKRHRSRASHDVHLIVGDDGVSLSIPQGASTVLFDDCTAMLRWPDGARQLFGADGMTVRIEPTLYPSATVVLDRIDSRIPQTAIVDMPARQPNEIPKPSRARSLRRRARSWLIPRRAWLDRVATPRGGIRQLLYSVGIAVAVSALTISAFAFSRPGLLLLAITFLGALIWRRKDNGHW
ncbi:hypothetical protein LQ51_07825 [Micromonospora sp. HK10]|nr:hypothetical protein LQ51_07825 [Micromonospora sp. HK10]